MSSYCKRCGENVGYLGKIVEFIYYRFFKLKMFKHECEIRTYNTNYIMNNYFIPTNPPREEKIGLIKKNNIKHKFIKNG